jgi:hypothetical protein
MPALTSRVRTPVRGGRIAQPPKNAMKNIGRRIAIWGLRIIAGWSSGEIYLLPNVRGEVSLLAFGAEGAQAASVTKVPQGQGLTRPLRSHCFHRISLLREMASAKVGRPSRARQAAAFGHDAKDVTGELLLEAPCRRSMGFSGAGWQELVCIGKGFHATGCVGRGPNAFVELRREYTLRPMRLAMPTKRSRTADSPPAAAASISRSQQPSEMERSGSIVSANVPDEESPLASGVLAAREAGLAGSMTEVPKGRGFAPSVCSHFSWKTCGTVIGTSSYLLIC